MADLKPKVPVTAGTYAECVVGICMLADAQNLVADNATILKHAKEMADLLVSEGFITPP